MALQQLGGKINYVKWSEAQPKQKFAGWYVGESISQRFGTKTIHLEDENGETLGLNLAGQLKYQLQNIQLGDYIMIIYEGKEDVKGKGLCHQFESYKDPDKSRTNRSVKDLPTSEPLSAPAEEYYGDHDDDDDDYDSSELPF